MQHTETYGLNLIETSDPFSPAPLNENTLALEAILAGLRTDLGSTGGALSDRVTALEDRRLAAGTYKGTGVTITISVGFTPRAVLVYSPRLGACCLAVTGSTMGSVSVRTGGFEAKNGSGSSQFSYNGDTYHYLAVR